MASLLPALPNGVSLTKTVHLGGASLAFDVTAQPGSDVLAALVENKPFPPRRVELAELAVKVQPDTPITLTGGAGSVSFTGSASAYVGAAVLDQPRDVTALLVRDRLNDHIADTIDFPVETGHRFVLLRWGYDLEGTAKGAMALGAGPAVSFGAEARRLGAYAVIRQLADGTGSQTALKETFDSWMLPTQFRELDDLRPGTWIVTEVDGSLALRIGAQYGYDFNWVREAVSLGNLAGDIGLKIQLGVSASVGFEASGQYALALVRPLKGRRMRLQLFRLDRKGLSFAFAAGGSAQASFNELLPDHFDEFIAGVFGIHGLQVLKDLDRWTDPNQKLSDLIAGVTDEYARRLLESVTGVDPAVAFESARARLVNLLLAWHELPHKVASSVYAIVQRDVSALAVLKPILTRFAREDATTFKPELEKLLGRVDFFATPFGQWIEAATLSTVLGAVSNRPEYEALQKIATQTLAVLDGGLLERTLVNLQREIADRLGLAQLESVVDQATFATVDDWLKARLAAFLDRQTDFTQVQQIREAAHRLLALRQRFFEQAREALTRKYEFQVIGRYQKATTRTALIDLDFNFDAPDGVPADLVKLARAAIDGDFNTVLLHPVAGVTLNQGVLTHEVTRQSHLEVTLPFFHAELDHVNRSLAKVQSLDADRGRILVYDLSADDLVTAKHKFSSRFAVHGRFTRGSRVRVFDEASMSHAYTFRQAVKNMRRKALESQLKTYGDAYFPETFRDGEGSLNTWIADLDRTVDRVLENGPDNFGNTLLSLEVSAPARLVGAWARAPLAKKAREYFRMSMAIQAQLKRLIPQCHFQDLDQFRTRMPSSVLLVYAALEPATGIRVDNGVVVEFMDEGDIYWDFDTSGRLEAMARHGLAIARLRSNLATIHDTLLQAEGMAGVASDYAPERVQTIVNDALGPGEQHLRNLLVVERSVIRKAHEAGLAIARALAEQKPTEAQKQLARFGSEVTEAFNTGIDSLFSGPALRPLGTMVFLEAARTFDPEVEAERPSAILELTVLRNNPAFDMASFIEGTLPRPEEVVRAEKIVSLV